MMHVCEVDHSEVLEYIFILLGLLVPLPFIVGGQLRCEFLIEALQPLVALDLRLERRRNLHIVPNTSLFRSLNQAWPKISYTSPWAPNLCFGFLCKTLRMKSCASGEILTFSENLTSPSLMSLNIKDWDLL
jgi:hypothetical protein